MTVQPPEEHLTETFTEFRKIDLMPSAGPTEVKSLQSMSNKIKSWN
jgi:hypothetical protein